MKHLITIMVSIHGRIGGLGVLEQARHASTARWTLLPIVITPAATKIEESANSNELHCSGPAVKLRARHTITLSTRCGGGVCDARGDGAIDGVSGTGARTTHSGEGVHVDEGLGR